MILSASIKSIAYSLLYAKFHHAKTFDEPPPNLTKKQQEDASRVRLNG